MGTEIERKFLVDTSLLPQAEGKRYVQGFISRSEDAVVRVRICEEIGEALLVVKGPLKGATRPEFDYEIPIEDARELMKLCQDTPIEKIRYRIEHMGHEWTVDEFLGENKGLWLAEIELDDEKEFFEKPPWAGREVTDDPRYYNVNLSCNPFSKWGGDPKGPRPQP